MRAKVGAAAAAVAVLALAPAAWANGGHGDRGREGGGGHGSKQHAHADAHRETTCVGPLGPVTVAGDLIVPAGTVCTLAGTQVLGGVIVLPGATLIATGAVVEHELECVASECIVTGGRVGKDVELEQGASFYALELAVGKDVECHRCGQIGIDLSAIAGKLEARDQTGGINLCGNSIGGSVKITGNRVFVDTCDGNVIGGSFTLSDSAPAALAINSLIGNQVGGSLIVEHNSGPLQLIANNVRGYLRCRANTPPPVSIDNTATKIDRECNNFPPPVSRTA
jgi:hypothetical protein